MQKCLHKCETLLGFSIKTKWRWFIEFPRGYLIEHQHTSSFLLRSEIFYNFLY